MTNLCEITVVNKHRDTTTPPDANRVNIMRGTPLGNPFVMRNKSANERCRVVDKYRKWLRREYLDRTSPARKELERLLELARSAPLELECCCAPLLCHGHVVLDAIQGMHQRETELLSSP